MYNIYFSSNNLSYRCVYTENDVTVLENKLIKKINANYLKKRKLSPVDLYKPKRISCEINPLYYSLAQYEDFSSSEYSDYEHFMCDDIVNQHIGNPPITNMDINSSSSVEHYLIESQSNGVCEEPILAKEEGFSDQKCIVNSKINKSKIGDKMKVETNLNCESQHDLIKTSNTSNDKRLNLEFEIQCNNMLDSSVNIQKSTKNLSEVKNVKDNVNCEPNLLCDDNFLFKDLNEEEITSNNGKTVKVNQETDDDLDVVSPHNFETFTVVKKNINGDVFYKHDNTVDIIDQNDQNSLKDDSISFQTFTIINENLVINDDSITQNNLVIKNEPETSNDYKTFTVVNRTISTPPPNAETQSSSSDSILSSSKMNINNNHVIDLDTLVLPHAPSQFETITSLPKSNNDENKIEDVDNSSKTLENDIEKLNGLESDSVLSLKENIKYDQVQFIPEQNSREDSENGFVNFVKSKDSILSNNFKQYSEIIPNKSCTVDDINSLNFISEDNSQNNSNINCQHLEKLKSTGESDSTLSLHLEILENNKGMNSPDSLNDDEVFGQEEKSVVSNKLEFVPLETMPIKDNRSPRLSRKYMECSPVISANAYVPDEDKSSTVEDNCERRNSSSFFIDFNQGKPKTKPRRFENLTKSLDSSTISTNKEKIFSMFIDFNEDSESSETSSKGTKHRKPQTLADRFVRMHSEDASIKNNDPEDTVTPPPSRMTSTVENSSVDISETCKKQSVFMFIENDSPAPVKRRTLPHSSRLKSQRNSWNVDSTVVHKTHHRTHSVNLSQETHLDERMTQSHIETGSKEFNKPLDSFDSVECSVNITVNGAKDNGIGLVDSFVRLSDMDKAPSQEIVNSLNRSESKSESLRRDLKNTELSKCLKRMFPYLKITEIERILLSKPPHSLDNIEEIKSGLGKDLLRMFLEEIGADTTIDINGRRIKAHKCVLTSRCQYFAAMFSGGWVQSAGNVLYLKG